MIFFLKGLSINTTTTSNPSTSSGQGILWGAGAMAVIGMAPAYALEQQKKREEEEAAKIAQVQAEVDAKNAAIEAKQIAMREQLKIKSWLEGQAILNAQIEALELRGATPAEIEAILAQASTQGFGASTAQVGAWLANWQAENVEEAIQADMTEGERYQVYVNSPEYIARQEELAEWQEQQPLEAAQEATFNHLLSEHQDGDANENKTLLERIGDWISSPSTWWGIGTETDEILKKADDIPMYLPIIRGIDPYIDDLTPLRAILVDKRAIRAVGRAIGDISNPILFGIGFTLTVAPNLYTNIRDKKPWNDTVADLIVDTGGFIVSEIAGVLAAIGVNALAPGLGTLATFGVKISADVSASIAWDILAEQNNWNGNVSNWLGATTQNFSQSMLNSFENSLDTSKYPPIPEAPIITQSASTPTPATGTPQIQPAQNSTPSPLTNSTPTPPP